MAKQQVKWDAERRMHYYQHNGYEHQMFSSEHGYRVQTQKINPKTGRGWQASKNNVIYRKAEDPKAGFKALTDFNTRWKK
jgi:hypothetical protein